MKFTNVPSSILLAFLVTTAYGRLDEQVNHRHAVKLISRNDHLKSYAQLTRKGIYEPQINPDESESAIRTIEQQFGAPPPAPPPKKQAPAKPNSQPARPQPAKPQPAKPQPAKPPQSSNNECNGKTGHGRLHRRGGCPLWPFSLGKSRNRREARSDQYIRPMPDHPHGNDMIQVGESQVGFLLKNSKLGWFITPNTAAESTAVGTVKAIGASDLGLCSMVALVNQHGAIVVHLSPNTCTIVQKGSKSGFTPVAVEAVRNDFKPLKQDTKLFFDVFKKEAGKQFLVLVAVGPQTNSQEYGEFMAKELFGISKSEIDHTINVAGSGNAHNSIGTFLIDFSGATPKVLHGATGSHLQEEPNLHFP